MIELLNASVRVETADGPLDVLRPTTLKLHEPRIALIGANGSGKSTLARLCNGLAEPHTGSVRITTPVRTLDTVKDGAAVRRTVGFVFTNPATQLVMPTVIEDVALSLRRSHPKKSDRLTAAHAALQRFDLAHLADRSVHALSGGQQQLLALTSVLAADPRIVVADEPTTLLDLRNTRRLTEVLLALPQQLIVATHQLSLAERCDRVIVIADGAVARDSAENGEAPAATVEWYRAHA